MGDSSNCVKTKLFNSAISLLDVHSSNVFALAFKRTNTSNQFYWFPLWGPSGSVHFCLSLMLFDGPSFDITSYRLLHLCLYNSHYLINLYLRYITITFILNYILVNGRCFWLRKMKVACKGFRKHLPLIWCPVEELTDGSWKKTDILIQWYSY